MSAAADVIDQLAGIVSGSRLAGIRAQRAAARDHAQGSYLALFEPTEPGDVTRLERYAVAAFVALLHRQPEAAAFYASKLADTAAVADAVAAEATAGAAAGPYGSYSPGPLSVEDRLGPIHRVAAANRAVLGARLSAGLEHAHLLVLRPRDASAAALQALRDAGWSTTDIVTLSQLVAFLAFQIRVVAGLRALAAVEGAGG